MRKAVAQTVGRRKSRKENPKNEKSTPEKKNSNGPPKMTPDEAALTAKNYRLAKELSELRVRHREECKTVTKLTMENMNLASRCREALGHVSVLKKELLKQQRRMDTLSKVQQQTHHKPKINGVVRVVDMSPEEKKEDESTSSSPNSFTTTPQAMASPKLVSSDDYEEDDSTSSSSSSNPAAEDKRSKSLSPLRQISKRLTSNATVRALLRPPSTPNKSSSPPREDKITGPVDFDTISSPEDDGDGIDDDSPVKATRAALFSSPQKDNRIFPHSASPKLPRNDNNYNEEYPGDITAGTIRHAHHSPRLGRFQEESQSSIDAFEASFQTSFPASFSPLSSTTEENQDAYNPFQTSPQRQRRPDTSSTDQPERKSPSLASADDGNNDKNNDGDKLYGIIEKTTMNGIIEKMTKNRMVEKTTVAATATPTKIEEDNKKASPVVKTPNEKMSLPKIAATTTPPNGAKEKPSIRTPTEKSFAATASADKTTPKHINANTGSTLTGKENSSTKSLKAMSAEKIETVSSGDTNSTSSSGGSGIRDRATAAYRRSLGQRWTGAANDPPGKDRTSTRKSGPLGGRKTATTTTSTSPATKTTTTTTPRDFRKMFSPSSPSPREIVENGYNTPSPPHLSPVISLSGEQPSRPEKTGFDEARARYEKALRPVTVRQNSGEIPYDTQEELSSSRSSPHRSPRETANGLAARIAAYSNPNKQWLDSAPPSDEEDGQIPMKSRARRTWEQGDLAFLARKEPAI